DENSGSPSYEPEGCRPPDGRITAAAVDKVGEIDPKIVVKGLVIHVTLNSNRAGSATVEATHGGLIARATVNADRVPDCTAIGLVPDIASPHLNGAMVIVVAFQPEGCAFLGQTTEFVSSNSDVLEIRDRNAYAAFLY